MGRPTTQESALRIAEVQGDFIPNLDTWRLRGIKYVFEVIDKEKRHSQGVLIIIGLVPQGEDSRPTTIMSIPPKGAQYYNFYRNEEVVVGLTEVERQVMLEELRMETRRHYWTDPVVLATSGDAALVLETRPDLRKVRQ
jgi:hypothetical protein